MAYKAPQSIVKKLPRRGMMALLVASLVVSGFLTAVALRFPACHWLTWISFLPLFVAVRLLRPLIAAAVGGLWGAGLFLFLVTGPASALPVAEPMFANVVGAAGPLPHGRGSDRATRFRRKGHGSVSFPRGTGRVARTEEIRSGTQGCRRMNG